eukprot:CAMPEP_0185857414 /NCGR_PEP_ID=MMETSP1354-20130828/29494_1 /TAXON_ID=708628 /ORGANISM="Erythrolobus madagascarensis, Strain CCMP3276" /LENGTH=480 /DNA_ID=CAMNT_0028559685 /DNA_START=25 /DNA_END=1467 /DNA_ORIENTATION=+
MECAFAVSAGYGARRGRCNVVRTGAAVSAAASVGVVKKAAVSRRHSAAVVTPSVQRRRRSAGSSTAGGVAERTSARSSGRRRTASSVSVGTKANQNGSTAKVRVALASKSSASSVSDRKVKVRRTVSKKTVKPTASSSTNAGDGTALVQKSRAPARLRSAASTTSFNTFMKEIAAVDLLSDEQICSLSAQLKQLVAWEELRDKLSSTLGREPSVAEWASTAGFAQEEFMTELLLARSAKKHMVAANLRLVVVIAKRYENLGVSLSDLIQEGSFGLVRGVEKFDHSRGYRFATYATWWVKHFIQLAIVNHSRAIRLPSHVSELARRLRRVRTELTMELNRDPSVAELAQRMQLSEDRVRFVIAKSSETSTVSLDVPLNSSEDGAATLGDVLTDGSAQPEELVARSLLKDDLEAVLLMLSPREREIVRLRYGFDDGLSRNYEEIGSLYCVPGNRIRQIETRALRKLRHPSYNSSLREYAYAS